ncbi:MAG TPA: pyridoxamine kinase [Candidatus Enterenecus avicola]|nr:pyridoxamine kinase [Candidatus Enterenecus avicola]
MRKVAAIHDLSCYGRCSLAVILPVLSVMGVQCCPLPGTVLSTHTGGFGPVARTDLTGQVTGTLRHWEQLGLTFDGIYTGYMATTEQIRQAMEAVERLSGSRTQVVVDPVLGDHGRLYASMTEEMARAMGELCAQAQVITPNLTEAAILLGLSPDALLDRRGGELAVELSGQGQRSVVVTGITPEPGYTGAVWFDHTTGTSGTTVAVRAPGEYPGTGDLFAAVLTGSLMMGESLERGVSRAAHFIARCASYTAALGTDPREGVLFEPLLPLLLGDALAMDDRI